MQDATAFPNLPCLLPGQSREMPDNVFRPLGSACRIARLLRVVFGTAIHAW